MIAGSLSDAFASRATDAAVSAEATGLHTAMLAVVPAFLLLGALAAYAASRTVGSDHARLAAGQTAPS